MNKVEEGRDYAQQVVDGEILVCQDIRLSCERFLRMLSLAENPDNPYRFSSAKVEHVLRFANVCVHVKGPQVGQRFVLAPWQVLTVCAIFGFVWRKNDLRVVTDVILFVPRKSGKSFWVSLVCNYLLLFPNGYQGAEEGGVEIYVTATDRDQASIVFEASQGLIDAMPKELADQYKLYKNTLHRADDRLSVFRTLSRDSKKNAVGRGASVHIVDEAAMVDRDSILAVDNGMIHRLAPLRINISTAHSTRDSLFFERMSYCSNMLRGMAEDNPKWFALMYAVPDGMAWDDPKSWYAANPMLGINVPETVYENLANQAKEMFNIRNEFLCRNLNYWVSAEAQWMPIEMWNSCPHEKPEGDPDTIIIGVDLAMTRDLNSVAMLSRYGDHYWLEIKSFLPKEAMRHFPADTLMVIEKAVNDGHILLTEGNVLDVGQIYAYIEQLTAIHTIDCLAYDPFNASALLLLVQEGIGIPLEKVGQGMSQLSAASKEFYQIISEKRMHFEDIAFHAWSLSKCTLYEDINSNWKVRKQEVTDKIDPIVASIIALKAMLDRPLFGGLNIAVF